MLLQAVTLQNLKVGNFWLSLQLACPSAMGPVAVDVCLCVCVFDVFLYVPVHAGYIDRRLWRVQLQ